MENMQKDKNEMELKLEEMMKVSGGNGDFEWKKEMLEAKRAGKSFEEWFSGSNYCKGLMASPGMKEIIRYFWITES